MERTEGFLEARVNQLTLLELESAIAQIQALQPVVDQGSPVLEAAAERAEQRQKAIEELEELPEEGRTRELDLAVLQVATENVLLDIDDAAAAAREATAAKSPPPQYRELLASFDSAIESTVGTEVQRGLGLGSGLGP